MNIFEGHTVPWSSQLYSCGYQALFWGWGSQYSWPCFSSLMTSWPSAYRGGSICRTPRSPCYSQSWVSLHPILLFSWVERVASCSFRFRASGVWLIVSQMGIHIVHLFSALVHKTTFDCTFGCQVESFCSVPSGYCSLTSGQPSPNTFQVAAPSVPVHLPLCHLLSTFENFFETPYYLRDLFPFPCPERSPFLWPWLVLITLPYPFTAT